MILTLLLDVLALMLAVFALILPIRFFKRWETKGYLAYAAISLAAGAITLSLGLRASTPPLFQAWFGIFGGLCAWTVSEMAHEAGLPDTEQGDGSVHFLMTLVFTLVAWVHLPLAAQFGITLFLMNWGGHIIIFGGRSWLGKERLTPIVDAVSILVILSEITYTVVGSTLTSISILWSASWIWIALSMIVFSRLY